MAGVVSVAGLAALAAGAGVGPVGVLAGVVYTVALLGLLAAAQRHAGRPRLGPADLVTLARAVLVGGVTAMVVDALIEHAAPTGVFIAVAAVALALDAVDGQVARRTGTTSAVGARFDMEVDAFLILVLSVGLVAGLGPWVLAIGGMRYGFVVAGRVVPWLHGSLAPTRGGKTVAALQGVVLVVANVVAGPVAVLLVAAALVALSWSFGRDVRRLHRATSRRVAGRGADRDRGAAEGRLGRARAGHAALRHEVAR